MTIFEKEKVFSTQTTNGIVKNYLSQKIKIFHVVYNH